jgi:hypothetical protein
MRKILFAGLAGALLLAGPAIAAAASIEAAGNESGPVYQEARDLGPRPGYDFTAELIRDCRETARRIAARPGASWNSEYGWAPEERCRAYLRGKT